MNCNNNHTGDYQELLDHINRNLGIIRNKINNNHIANIELYNKIKECMEKSEKSTYLNWIRDKIPFLGVKKHIRFSKKYL